MGGKLKFLTAAAAAAANTDLYRPRMHYTPQEGTLGDLFGVLRATNGDYFRVYATHGTSGVGYVSTKDGAKFEEDFTALGSCQSAEPSNSVYTVTDLDLGAGGEAGALVAVYKSSKVYVYPAGADGVADCSSGKTKQYGIGGAVGTVAAAAVVEGASSDAPLLLIGTTSANDGLVITSRVFKEDQFVADAKAFFTIPKNLADSISNIDCYRHVYKTADENGKEGRDLLFASGLKEKKDVTLIYRGKVDDENQKFTAADDPVSLTTVGVKDIRMASAARRTLLGAKLNEFIVFSHLATPSGTPTLPWSGGLGLTRQLYFDDNNALTLTMGDALWALQDKWLPDRVGSVSIGTDCSVKDLYKSAKGKATIATFVLPKDLAARDFTASYQYGESGEPLVEVTYTGGTSTAAGQISICDKAGDECTVVATPKLAEATSVTLAIALDSTSVEAFALGTVAARTFVRNGPVGAVCMKTTDSTGYVLGWDSRITVYDGVTGAAHTAAWTTSIAAAAVAAAAIAFF